MEWICAVLLYFFHFSLQFIFYQLSHSIARLIANCFFFFIRGKIKKNKDEGEKGGVYKVRVKSSIWSSIFQNYTFYPLFFSKFKFWYKTYFLLFLNPWFVREVRALLDFSVEREDCRFRQF